MPGNPVFERGLLQLKGGHLNYHRVGHGDHTILLLHGLGDSGLCWSRTATALADDFSVIMLDARGHGRSSMPPASQADDPALDILAVLDCLGLDQVFVLGHSIGAIAASQFTAAHNHRVSALVLEDPTFRDRTMIPSADMIAAFTKQMSRFGQMSSEEAIAAGKQQHPTWDQDEFAAWAEGKRQVNPSILKHYAFPGWRDVVPQLQVPTLMMRGEPGSDSSLSTELAAQMTSANPYVQSVVIDGAGHNIRREQFDRFLAVLREFLSQHV